MGHSLAGRRPGADRAAVVGRPHAARCGDALAYGCDGLLGIHWRTRVLGPNVGALAQAAWEQGAWAKAYRAAAKPPEPRRVAGPIGGEVAAYPDNPIADTTDPAIYQTVRYNLLGYRLPATNGPCTVTLHFSEPHYDTASVRVFDVKLQGQRVLKSLDIFARVGKNRALDFTYTNIVVTNGWLDIDFVPVIEFPSIAGIVVEGAGFGWKINCGGPAQGDYAADLPRVEPPQAPVPLAKDFYLDWATRRVRARNRRGCGRHLHADGRRAAQALHLGRRPRRHTTRRPALGTSEAGVRVRGSVRGPPPGGGGSGQPGTLRLLAEHLHLFARRREN